MNKRGMSLGLELTVVAIAALVVVAIYFIIIGNTSSSFQSGISQVIPNAMELQVKRCTDLQITTAIPDTDKDGLADICDLCISPSTADTDGDYMPDVCDRHIDSKTREHVPDTSPVTACCGKGKSTCDDILRNGRNFQCSSTEPTPVPVK